MLFCIMSFCDTPPEVNCDEPESFKCDGCKKTVYDEAQEIVEELKAAGGFIVHEYCYECYDKLIDED